MQAITSDESGYDSAVSNLTTALTHSRVTDHNVSSLPHSQSSAAYSHHHGENVQTAYSDTDALFDVDDVDPMQV